MEQKYIIQIERWVAVIGISSLLLFAGNAYAEEVAYVDADAKSGGDGSKKNPFQTIEDALEEGADEIRIASGTYKEDIIVPKGVSVEGDGKDTIIFGKVTLEDETELEDLTVRGGWVRVADGADATLEACTIEDANKNALETSGKGTLVVRDVTIKNSSKKGMYIQSGKDIDIRGSVVRDNAEEGIDIRENVDGVIRGNTIRKNGESGIEVIVGKSELDITDNTIISNGSSGIAVQYYDIASAYGAITISGNILKGNDQYGVSCKFPSNPAPASSYWEKSITLSGNTFSKNGDGSVYDVCHMLTEEEREALKKEQEREEELEDSANEETENVENDKVNTAALASVMLLEKLAIEEQILLEEIDGWKMIVDKKREDGNAAIEQLNEESIFTTFFLGPDKSALSFLKRNTYVLGQLERVIMKKEDVARRYGLYKELETLTVEISNVKKRHDQRIQEEQDHFSVPSFFRLFFY